MKVEKKNNLYIVKDYSSPKKTFPSVTPDEDQALLDELVEILKSKPGRDMKGKMVLISDSTHTDYMASGNLRFYDTETVRSKDFRSWFEPFPKPIIWDHNESLPPMGRVYTAKWVPVPGGVFPDGTPCKGIVKTGDYIVDPDAIKKIEDDIYLTQSSGMSAGSVTCNICGSDYGECDHTPGNIYEDSKCLLHFKDLTYSHRAYVNDPAHPHSAHVNVHVMDGQEAKDWLAHNRLMDASTKEVQKVTLFEHFEDMNHRGKGDTKVYYDINLSGKKYFLFDGGGNIINDNKDKDKGDEEMDIEKIIDELLKNKKFTDTISDSVGTAVGKAVEKIKPDSSPSTKDGGKDSKDSAKTIDATEHAAIKARVIELERTNATLSTSMDKMSEALGDARAKLKDNLVDMIVLLGHVSGETLDQEYVKGLKNKSVDFLTDKLDEFAKGKKVADSIGSLLSIKTLNVADVKDDKGGKVNNDPKSGDKVTDKDKKDKVEDSNSSTDDDPFVALGKNGFGSIEQE